MKIDSKVSHRQIIQANVIIGYWCMCVCVTVIMWGFVCLQVGARGRINEAKRLENLNRWCVTVGFRVDAPKICFFFVIEQLRWGGGVKPPNQ